MTKLDELFETGVLTNKRDLATNFLVGCSTRWVACSLSQQTSKCWSIHVYLIDSTLNTDLCLATEKKRKKAIGCSCILGKFADPRVAE